MGTIALAFGSSLPLMMAGKKGKEFSTILTVGILGDDDRTMQRKRDSLEVQKLLFMGQP